MHQTSTSHQPPLLVAGGAAGPNLAAVVACLHKRAVAHEALLVRAHSHPPERPNPGLSVQDEPPYGIFTSAYPATREENRRVGEDHQTPLTPYPAPLGCHYPSGTRDAPSSRFNSSSAMPNWLSTLSPGDFMRTQEKKVSQKNSHFPLYKCL
jgi:hypothetical protein